MKIFVKMASGNKRKINFSHVVKFGEKEVYVWTDITKDPDLYTATNCKDFAYLKICFVEWCCNDSCNNRCLD